MYLPLQESLEPFLANKAGLSFAIRDVRIEEMIERSKAMCLKVLARRVLAVGETLPTGENVLLPRAWMEPRRVNFGRAQMCGGAQRSTTSNRENKFPKWQRLH